MSVPGTPAWLRTQNDRGAFRLLLEHGPLSRSRLGELSGLSKPTASQMIARLERIGLIAPVGETSGSRGPNAVVYGVREESLTGVAISILSDAIEAVVVGPTGRHYPTAEIPLGELGERSPVSDVRAGIQAACGAAEVRTDSVSVVTVSVQAAVDIQTDSLSFTDTLPGWPHNGARQQIERALGLQVILENDVNLAVIAERASGEVDDLGSFALLWLGEGLGLGLDAGGALQRGAFGGAGEIGYLEVPRSAMTINESARDFTDLLGRDAILTLAGKPLGSRFREAVNQLDDAAFEQLATRIALLAAPILAVSDPAALLLGGPTGIMGGDHLATLVEKRITPKAKPGATAAQVRAPHGVQVRTSRAGTHSVLQGARQLLVEAIRERLAAVIEADTMPDA